MDWDDMRVFLALARVASLGRAGQVLKMDPATVGRRVSRLEGHLGRRLFHRSHQGYALTEDGLRLLPHVEAAQAHLSAAETPNDTGAGLKRANPPWRAGWLRELPFCRRSLPGSVPTTRR